MIPLLESSNVESSSLVERGGLYVMLVLFFFLLTLELILFKISMSKNLSHLGDQMVSLTLIYKNKKNFESNTTTINNPINRIEKF